MEILGIWPGLEANKIQDDSATITVNSSPRKKLTRWKGEKFCIKRVSSFR